MTMLLYSHSGFRYLVLLLGVAAALYAVYGLVTRRPLDRRMQILASAFAGSFHVQILLGLGLLFTGSYGSIVIGHIIPILFAAVVAQLVPSVMRRRRQEQRSFVPYLIASVVALALAATGIIALGRPIVG